MTAVTTKLGKNYRLQVGNGQATETFVSIAGEQSLSFSTSPDKIDGSSKDDGDYKVEFYGQQSISLQVSGKVKLPDTGLGLLDTARKTLGSAIDIQIVDTLNANAVKWAASMSVGAFKWDGNDKDAVTYSFDLAVAAAPTVDSFFS